jgi:hypothetical protein
MNGESTDKALSKALKEWRVDAALPPRFQESVWHRIESADVDAIPIWKFVAQRIAAVLARPAMATAYLAILLAIGATAGWTHARQENAQVKGQLSDRYIRVLDPYAPPR